MEDRDISSYRKEVINRLFQLENIIFYDGASKGQGIAIQSQLNFLINYKRENLKEHNKIIESKENYMELYEMFPDWEDKNKLIEKYKAMDNSLFGTLLKLKKC